MKAPSGLTVPGHVIHEVAPQRVASWSRDTGWREAAAGLLASAGFLALIFPLSFSLLASAPLAVVIYVALRLLLLVAPAEIETPLVPSADPIAIEPDHLRMLNEPAPTDATVPVVHSPAPYGLTRRELEILPLLAQRLTDREIAERLFISEKTAMRHVSHVLGKLGLKSRREVAAFIEQHPELRRSPQ